MAEDASQTSAPRTNGHSAPKKQEEFRRLDATVRDLIGRMDHVRERLQEQDLGAADIAELVTLLDTTDARLVLGLNLADLPCQEPLNDSDKERPR